MVPVRYCWISRNKWGRPYPRGAQWKKNSDLTGRGRKKEKKTSQQQRNYKTEKESFPLLVLWVLNFFLLKIEDRRTRAPENAQFLCTHTTASQSYKTKAQIEVQIVAFEGHLHLELEMLNPVRPLHGCGGPGVKRNHVVLEEAGRKCKHGRGF